MLQKGFYEFGHYRADLAQGILERKGQHVHLTPKAFEILIVLLENAGKIVDKDTLLERCWRGIIVEEGNLAYNINMIRKALDDSDNSSRHIKNYRKRGYVYEGEVKYVLQDAGGGAIADQFASEPPAAIHQPGTAPGDNADSPHYVETIPSRGDKLIAGATKGSPKWWKRHPKIIIGLALIIIISAAVFLYLRQPEKVFPQFGKGTISDNSRNISAEMKRELKDCQGDCLEGVKKGLVIDAILEEGGFAVVEFNKLFGSEVPLKRHLVLKAKLSAQNPKFEVGLKDARQTTVYFNCQAPANGQEYHYLVNLDAESLTKNDSKFQPQHTRSFSVGFAADAGSTPGRQSMEVFGVVSSDNFPVTFETRPCEQRKPK